MIVSMALPNGQTVHVCPDNEPVFTAHEIALMFQIDTTPAAAAFMSLLKTTFPGLKLVEVEGPQLKGAEQMAFLGFNVDEAPDSQDFTVMPAGDYTAMVTASELLSNKAGTGSYLKLELTVIDEKYAGRKLYENLNLDNPSAQAVEIARGLTAQGFTLVATGGTQKIIADAGIACEKVLKISEGRPSIEDIMKNGDISLAINTSDNQTAKKDAEQIRQIVLRMGIPYFTTLSAARAAIEAMAHMHDDSWMKPQALQDYLIQ